MNSENDYTYICITLQDKKSLALIISEVRKIKNNNENENNKNNNKSDLNKLIIEYILCVCVCVRLKRFA